MSKVFCQQCGAGNEAVSKRPNFCGSCGNPFPWNKAVAAKPVVQKQAVVEEPEEDYYDDQEYDLSQSLVFDLDVGKGKSLTVGDLYKNPALAEGSDRVPPKNAKKILDNLRERVRKTSRIELD
jgi:hypothetical protein